jgi:hypothetical protein
VAAPALAQVPQDTTYTGRLVDGLGDPLAGPVDLTLRIFEADTGGTPLYSEEHLGVALDATGASPSSWVWARLRRAQLMLTSSRA